MLEESKLDSLFEGLVKQGFFIWDNFIDPVFVQSYKAAILRNRREGELVKAGIGKESDYMISEEVRGDYISWIEENEKEFSHYFDKLRELTLHLNRNLFLGIRDKEMHLAYYPPGGGYVRHIDNFNSGGSRILSIITYLNDEWQDGHGGELRIHLNEERGEVLDITPSGGKMVCFLSDKIVHEVLKAEQPRMSITGWLLKEKVLF